MASINGIAFVIIGITVAVISKIVDISTDANSMVLFFFAGIMMAVYGAVKLFIFKEKKSGFEKNYLNIKPRAQTNQTPYAQNFRYCPSCRTPVSLQSNFCYKCGARVKQ